MALLAECKWHIFFFFFRRLEVSTLARLLMPGEAKALDSRPKVLEGIVGKKDCSM